MDSLTGLGVTLLDERFPLPESSLVIAVLVNQELGGAVYVEISNQFPPPFKVSRSRIGYQRSA